MNKYRVNEILSQLHNLRHGGKSNSSIPFHQRMLAQNLPLNKKVLLDYIKQKLNSSKYDDGTNKRNENQPPVSIIEKVQVNALDNIREEIQSSLLETADNITTILLSRLIVDISNSIVKNFQ